MCQRNRLSPVCPEEKLVMDATANNCPELFLRCTLERLSYRDLLMSSYRWEARRISGARYQRVATYSVKLGSPCWSTVICESERARPKSHIFTKQSPSSRTFDGYTDIQSHSCNFSDTENISITSRNVKVAHTRLPSVGFRSWSQLLAVSLQMRWVINPAVGCHYFLPGPQLPSQPLRGLSYQFCCLVNRSTMGVNS